MYFNTFSTRDDHAGFLHSFHIYLIVLSEAVNRDTITVFRLHGRNLALHYSYISFLFHTVMSVLIQAKFMLNDSRSFYIYVFLFFSVFEMGMRGKM